MARIHQPLQKKDTGRWDYTVSSDEEGWAHATGYCAGWKDPDETDKWLEEHYGAAMKVRPEEREKLYRFKEKFHSDGHATAAEAEACHLEYELDFELRFWEDENSQRKCDSCGRFTTGRASLGEFCRYALCKEHQTFGEVRALRTKKDRELDAAPR